MNTSRPGAGTTAPETVELDPRVTRYLAERVEAFESEIDASPPAGPTVQSVVGRIAATPGLSPVLRLLLAQQPVAQGLLRERLAGTLPTERKDRFAALCEGVLTDLREQATELEKDVCEDFLAYAALPGHREEVVRLASNEGLDPALGRHQHQILEWWLRAKVTGRSMPKLLAAMAKAYLAPEDYPPDQLERAAHRLDSGVPVASVLSELRAAFRHRADTPAPCPEKCVGLPPVGQVTAPVPVMADKLGGGDTRTAATLLQLEAYGDGLGMFDGVRTLVRRWEAGDIRFSDEKINTLLYCQWQRGERLDTSTRASLYGAVRSTRDFPELWNTMIRAVGRYVDAEARGVPEAVQGEVGDSVALSAVLAACLRVRARLATAVTGLTDRRTRELYCQYTEATELLAHQDVVAAFAPGGDIYQVADALARLDDRPTGDLWGGYTRAYAVSTVLDELVDLEPGSTAEDLRELIEAAALLRPA
ncbi:hypothetical protein [Longispora urticae]